MSQAAINDTASALGRRLLDALLDIAPEHVPALLQKLAGNGDVAALSAAVDAFVARGIPHGLTKVRLFQAVVPILCSAPGEPATRLVAAWRDVLGGVSPRDLDQYLGSAWAAVTARALMLLGADPNAPSPVDAGNIDLGLTVLGSVHCSSGLLHPAVLEMLAALAARNELPLAYCETPQETGVAPLAVPLFDLLLTPGSIANNANDALLAHQLAHGVPDNWRRDAARALLAHAAGNRLARFGKPAHLVEMRMLALARFADPGDWSRIFAAGEPPSALAENLMRNTSDAYGAPYLDIIGRMLDDGIDPDAVACAISGSESCDCTLLHGAVYHGNAAMVELLLAHGADPLRRTRPAAGGTGETVLELAVRCHNGGSAGQSTGSVEGRSRTLQLLHAWQARRAITDSLAHAARPSLAYTGDGQ